MRFKVLVYFHLIKEIKTFMATEMEHCTFSEKNKNKNNTDCTVYGVKKISFQKLYGQCLSACRSVIFKVKQYIAVNC